MKNPLRLAMAEITALTRSGKVAQATAAIRRVLGGTAGGGSDAAPPQTATATVLRRELPFIGAVLPKARTAARPRPHAAPQADRAPAGQFLARSFSNAAGARDYKLYVPLAYASQPMPLVVMLHGCTQDPDDFARGTRMNQLAETEGFLVAYPTQSTGSNNMRCWNWFNTSDQQRGDGEPEIIAGITREIAAAYAVDPQRIYVAGLSAGGAMAVTMGATYPELFAAVGVHSGLDHAVASDVPSALTVMRNGVVIERNSRAALSGRRPTIVFHGDADRTVSARNGERVVNSVLASLKPANREVVNGGDATGRTYTLTRYTDSDSHTVLEHWQLHGVGHAWSGGSSTGSHTEPDGPDASAEMLRFFSAHPRRAH